MNEVLGFSNRWYAPAIAAAQRITIAGLDVRVVTAVYFLRPNSRHFADGDEMTTAAVTTSRMSSLWSMDVRSFFEKWLRLPTMSGPTSPLKPEAAGHACLHRCVARIPLPDSASQGRVPLLIGTFENPRAVSSVIAAATFRP